MLRSDVEGVKLGVEHVVAMQPRRLSFSSAEKTLEQIWFDRWPRHVMLDFTSSSLLAACRSLQPANHFDTGNEM
jgi:hypothetical protein